MSLGLHVCMVPVYVSACTCAYGGMPTIAYEHERVCEHVFTTPLCAGMCVHKFQCVYCM